ncbi:MAG TPA: 6-phosphogluconolactonase [Oligoflexia bacterium]|nr:6-phosphogluconolactonase [Oligoflexia bacterium]HMP48792.1 6-phosphogluconolactonase [Oligoflexia bacterium]
MSFFEFTIEKSAMGVTPVIEDISGILTQRPLVGFCGGSSIVPVLQGLRNFMKTSSSPFVGADALMIDERLVPSDHSDSNIKVIKDNLGDAVKNINLLPFNTTDPLDGFRTYENMLDSHGGIFDLIFLGVGEDAHVAGLFPGMYKNSDGENRRNFFTFQNSPKPPSGRMTASPDLIKMAKNVVLMFFGESKKSAYYRYIRADESPLECPVLLARSESDSIDRRIWLLKDF